MINVETRKEGYQEAALSKKKFDLSHKKLYRVLPFVVLFNRQRRRIFNLKLHFIDLIIE